MDFLRYKNLNIRKIWYLLPSSTEQIITYTSGFGLNNKAVEAQLTYPVPSLILFFPLQPSPLPRTWYLSFLYMVLNIHCVSSHKKYVLIKLPVIYHTAHILQLAFFFQSYLLRFIYMHSCHSSYFHSSIAEVGTLFCKRPDST